MGRKVHIIIPTYDGWAMTHTLLWSLYKHEKTNIDTVLVVDDFSNDMEETELGAKWWGESKMFNLSLLSPAPENKGFLRTANSGIMFYEKEDPNDIVLLLSNDVLIFGKFIDQIRDILNGDGNSVVGGVLYSHDTGWNKFGEIIFPYLEGWLLATTIANWGKLEYFDERYAPCDYEDVDLSTKARKMKMNLVPLNNPQISHIGGQTIKYSANRLENTKKNQVIFGEKWT